MAQTKISDLKGTPGERLNQAIEWSVANSKSVSELWDKANVSPTDVTSGTNRSGSPMNTSFVPTEPVGDAKGNITEVKGLQFTGIKVDLAQCTTLKDFAANLGHELTHVADIKAIGPSGNTAVIAGNKTNALEYYKSALGVPKIKDRQTREMHWIERYAYQNKRKILSEID